MSLKPVCRNARIDGRRTSLRMEPILWEALEDISQREEMSVNELLEQIDQRRDGAGLTSSVRAFIISYYYAATREENDTPVATQRGHMLRQALDIFQA